MATASQATIDSALSILRQVAMRYPQAYADCHTGKPTQMDYTILALRELNKFDSKFGMNGKRGGDSPSIDALFYGSKTDTGSVIDFLSAAGEQGNNLDKLVWQDVSSAAPGKWLDPNSFQLVGNYDGGTSDNVKLIEKLKSDNPGKDIFQLAAIGYAQDKRIGNKKAGANNPISSDTLGVLVDVNKPQGSFEAIKVFPTVSSFGIVGAPQVWVAPSSSVQPNPQPTPQPTMKPYIGDVKLNELGQLISKDYQRASHPLDGGIAIWIGRTLHDYYAGLAWDESVTKHRMEWCQALGVTVQ